ncbi:MAG: flagellar assembly protein FliH [Candidatus Eremiobacteraeota bacterium]|nr:flagellar assembly protein FliH [Candidatus Eremiobacteraeota bacterium]
MPEPFVRFSALLRSVATAPESPIEVEDFAEAVVTEQVPPTGSHPTEIEIAREVVHFRARVAESFETACDRLVREFARELLARELHLGPADITEIVRTACVGIERDNILRIRVNPQDATGLSTDIPVSSDHSLARGDAIIELCHGSIDASLGVRFESLLAATSVHAGG